MLAVQSSNIDIQQYEDSRLYDPLIAVKRAMIRAQAVSMMVDQNILKKGIHFGAFSFGNSDKEERYSLLKPGAEVLCTAFNFEPRFVGESIIEDFDNDFFQYRYRCELYDIESGKRIASGIGSCNSKESKYRYRNAKLACPACDEQTLMVSKFNKSEYYCRTCRSNFPKTDEKITSQSLGKIENPDISDLTNTIDKMAQKRALVAAVLIGACASEFFTQDLEDIRDFIDYGSEYIVSRFIPDPDPEPSNGKSEATPAAILTGDEVKRQASPVQSFADTVYDIVGEAVATIMYAKYDNKLQYARAAIQQGCDEGVLKADHNKAQIYENILVYMAERAFQIDRQAVEKRLGVELVTDYFTEHGGHGDGSLATAWQKLRDSFEPPKEAIKEKTETENPLVKPVHIKVMNAGIAKNGKAQVRTATGSLFYVTVESMLQQLGVTKEQASVDGGHEFLNAVDAWLVSPTKFGKTSYLVERPETDQPEAETEEAT